MIGRVGVVVVLTGGGGAGDAVRLGWVDDTVVGVDDSAEGVGAGVVPLTAAGVTAVSRCCSPPNASTAISKASGSAASSIHRRARLLGRSAPRPIPPGGDGSGAESTVSVLPVGSSPPPTPWVRVDPTELSGPGVAVSARGAPRVFQPYPPPSYPWSSTLPSSPLSPGGPRCTEWLGQNDVQRLVPRLPRRQFHRRRADCRNETNPSRPPHFRDHRHHLASTRQTYGNAFQHCVNGSRS